jgi:hypothetical protein
MSAQDEAVMNCVNGVLVSHGWSSAIDPDGAMGGYYKYKQPLMIPFHNQVRICLASKRFEYDYPENNAYMAKTLAMTLTALYAEIDGRTKPIGGKTPPRRKPQNAAALVEKATNQVQRRKRKPPAGNK